MKKIALLFTLLGALGACNTIAGMAQDVESGARAVGRAF